MYKGLKSVAYILFVIVALSFLQVDTIKAYELKKQSALLTTASLDGFLALDEKQNVLLTKTWTIKCNQALNPTTVNSQNIGVIDFSANENITVLPKMDEGGEGKTILVSLPVGTQYTANHSYYLYLTKDVQSLSGKSLNPVKMKFTTEKIVVEENTMYTAIKNGLLNAEAEINIATCSDYDGAKVKNTIDAAVKENPLILYYTGADIYSSGKLQFKYSREQNISLAHVQAIKNKVKEMIAEVIRSGMDDYEKEKAVHDYIINNARYDTKGFETNTIAPEGYSAYGVLINGIGVCESYAEAMQYSMQQLGIECRIVMGTASGVPHEWNIIKINGNWYQLDPTWDDPVSTSGKDILSYNYFNITDKETKRDHVYSTEYPICSATVDNYFYRNKLVIDTYAEFYAKIKEALLNKKTTVEMKILNYNTSIYNIRQAVDKFYSETPSYSYNVGYSYPFNIDGPFVINFIYKASSRK